MDVTSPADDELEADLCWCCGTPQRSGDVVRLGNHPEVTVCLPCAHVLHKQANGLEDGRRSGVAPRVRDAMRNARRTVVARGWHRSPLTGPPLRWVGRYLP